MMPSLAGASRRTLLNYCFMAHAILSGFVGVAALVFPHLIGVFFGEEVCARAFVDLADACVAICTLASCFSTRHSRVGV